MSNLSEDIHQDSVRLFCVTDFNHVLNEVTCSQGRQVVTSPAIVEI